MHIAAAYWGRRLLRFEFDLGRRSANSVGKRRARNPACTHICVKLKRQAEVGKDGDVEIKRERVGMKVYRDRVNKLRNRWKVSPYFTYERTTTKCISPVGFSPLPLSAPEGINLLKGIELVKN